MKHKSEVNRTIVVSLLTLIVSTVCAGAGIYAIADRGLVLGPDLGIGVLLVGLGIAVWIGPPLFWFHSARGSEHEKVEA